MADVRAYRRDNPWSRLVVGAGVLSFGLIVWLDHVHRIRASDYLQWWSVALVALGVAHLVERRWTSAVILIVLGALFLPSVPIMRQLYLRELMGMWPLLISVGGATLVVQALRPAAKDGARSGTFRVISIMGGNGRTVGASELVGGDAISVMGGSEIDLSRATLTREAVIDVLAFWGGIGIKVPRTWRIETRVAAVLGGVVDMTSNGTRDKTGPLLVIRGSVIMGGIEIRNPREEQA
jgi:hypothetical protein